MNRGIKIILGILITGIIICLGILLGIRLEQKRLADQEQLETVNEIAIVNMDTGVLKDGKQIFYSESLMEISDETFISANLEEARNGIMNGNFAAYIIIPSSFSSNAESINDIPSKVKLEYGINPHLRQDVSNITIANIKNFETQLNTNMSYMYVQAILDEFHKVQDSSGMIMDNDVKDMENLNQINPEELTEDIELHTYEKVPNTVQEVDLTEQINQNTEYADELEKNYKQFVENGKSEFAKVKESGTEVKTYIAQLQTDMEQIDFVNDEEGNPIGEQGYQKLGEELDLYEENLLTAVKEIKIELGWQETEPMPTPTPTPMPTETTSLITTQSSKQILMDNLEDIIEALDELPILDREKMNELIKNDIVAPYRINAQSETEKIAEEVATVNDGIDTYLAKQEAFDPYEFYDKEKETALINSFQTNAYAMQKKVTDAHAEYQEYVDLVEENADTTIYDWNKQLNQSYEKTELNVKSAVNSAKQNRENINTINLDILGSFEKKLPYTRLGKLEYVQAYDFIVKPVVSVNAQGETETKAEQSEYVFIWILLYILMAALGIVILVLLVNHIRHREEEKE